MPDMPLLILPSPGQPERRQNRPRGGGNIGLPSRQRQVQRLGPKFTKLRETFDARRVQLRTEATGIIPEEVLVFETVGSVEDFIVAVRNVEGMEWLGEIEEEDIPPDDDFFALDSQGRRKSDKTLRGRIFLVFSNHRALEQMLSFWQRWQRGERLTRGLRKWEKVFSHLRDIRPWGVQDRLLETGVIDDWRERVDHNEEILPCEIELWFRRDPNMRRIAQNRVIELVSAQRGRIVSNSFIEDIAYHALLVELPVAAVSNILEETAEYTALVQCEQIQFFRPTGQMAGILAYDEQTTDDTNISEQETALRDPVIALLDGLPLQSHRRLARHLIVDDPDNIETQYQAQERRHGTAMASLILWGDLDGNEPQLLRKLYVRPIMRPSPHDWRQPREEIVPENVLVVDLIHRAVRRIFEGEMNEPPVAPSVRIINLSIGYKDRLFDGALSPLARLLDWLAWKYKVLFIVSVGNHTNPLDIGIRWEDFRVLPDRDRQELVIKTIAADARNRRLRPPAEAVNVLTIGALHNDKSNTLNVNNAIVPYVDENLPSPINAQGMGFRRAIKPEVLAPGGKVVLMERIHTNPSATCDIYFGTQPPGQKVAAPGSTPGDLTAAWYTRGTSNATALTSRAAGILYDLLEDLRNEPGGELIDEIPLAIWLKTLLIHSAEWRHAGHVLNDILRSSQNSRHFKEYVTRLLGYGSLDVNRVRKCAEHRVTALSGGNLESDQAHLHRFPLPPSLSGQRGWRRLTITLAWFTPVNPAHQNWRRAALWFDPPKDLLRVERKQAHWQAVRRGTVQHEVLEGSRASAFVDSDNLEILVNCMADAGALDDSVPYALAVTLEVAEDIEINVYEEVRVRIHAAQVRVSP